MSLLGARRVGWACLLALPVLAVLVYYFSYRSGCLFDGKQGYGDYSAIAPFFWSSVACAALMALCYPAGIHLVWRPAAPVLCGVLALSAIFAIPAVFLLAIEGQVHGTEVCKPI